MYVCLLITLTRSPKAELRRAQLNGIGRMPMKGASGCRQTVMNDPGAQQPGQQQSYTTIETYTAKHDIVNRFNEYFINIEGREGSKSQFPA